MTIAGTQTASDSAAQPKHGLEVLIIEDSIADSELILRELHRTGFDASGCVVRTAGEFREKLKGTLPDIILADYNLGEWRGMDALEILRREGLQIPLILVSGALGDETAVECIKQGASDYVLKDKLGRLSYVINRALQEKRLRFERQEADDKLTLKIEQLARSNRDLEQFAYVASHDLQEPLRMVSAYTQLLGERYRGKLDEQADKYIHYAIDGATRMQDLIHDLLRFSRVGREEMVFQATDCKIVVRQAISNLQASIQETASTVTFKHLPVLMANGSQLEQVFQNLISNAIKFRDGSIPFIEIGAEFKEGSWIFSVSDNGIGIAPEHAEVIFSIFQRLHTRTEYSGNGIGLSICKKIIEQHGGKIWLGNHSGPGCTFNFSIPAMENGVAKKNEENQRSAAGG
ncbi:MAG: sensor histidine kinase [Terriglobales bacterium]